MLAKRTIWIVLPALISAAGCATSSLPALPPAQRSLASQDIERGSLDLTRSASEVVKVLPGNPTDVYALVARGALRCWFGVDGAFKTTHVFHAEADPPAKGGAAEIVLHERDDALRDKRGVRAVRVSFGAVPAGVRVGIDAPKMDRQLAEIVAKDVMAWASGHAACSLQRPVPASAKGVAPPLRAR